MAGPDQQSCPRYRPARTVAGKLPTATNNLAVHNSALAAQSRPTRTGDLTPADVTSHTGRKVACLCPCGYEWLAQVNNRHRAAGCPHCHRNPEPVIQPAHGKPPWRCGRIWCFVSNTCAAVPGRHSAAPIRGMTTESAPRRSPAAESPEQAPTLASWICRRRNSGFSPTRTLESSWAAATGPVAMVDGLAGFEPPMRTAEHRSLAAST
jgi:hypothetical protein